MKHLILLLLLPLCLSAQLLEQGVRQIIGEDLITTNASFYGDTRFLNHAHNNTVYSVIHTEVIPNTWQAAAGSSWNSNSFDVGMLMGVNPLGLPGYRPDWPSYYQATEDYYVTQEGIPQVEYYHVYVNPRVPFNNRPFSITPHLNDNAIEAQFSTSFLTLTKTTGQRGMRFSPGGGGTVGSFNHYYDDGTMLSQSVGPGAATLISAIGTNASLTFALNGGGNTIVSPTGLRVVHGGTGNDVLNVNRSVPSLSLNNPYGNERFRVDLDNENTVLHLKNSAQIEKIRLHSAGTSFFLGPVDLGTNAIVGGSNLVQMISDLQARINALEQPQMMKARPANPTNRR